MNTQSIIVEGAVTNGYRVQFKKVLARFTSETDEALSLETGDTIITVPYKQIEKLIKEVRKAKK